MMDPVLDEDDQWAGVFDEDDKWAGVFDEDDKPTPAVDALARLTRMAAVCVQLDAKIATAEEQLKSMKEDRQRLEFVAMPELMREVGLVSAKLASGLVMTLNDDVKASITEARAAAAFEWLDANNFGGLIKTDVITNFGAGEYDQAKALFEELAGEEMSVELKRKVEPQTLLAFVREQKEKGKPIPDETFGVFPFTRVKLSLSKSAKKAKGE